MAPISTGSFPKLLWPGIKNIYGLAYKEHKAEYPDIYDLTTSDKAFEEVVGVTGFGLAPVKTQAGAVAYDTATQGYTKRYTNVTYGLGFIITMEMYEDNQYAQFSLTRATALAFSMRQTKETVSANVLNRGFNANYAQPDGKALLATDHVKITGGSWSNELTTPADLSEAALEQACIDIGKFTNDRGMKIAVRPMTLIVPVDQEFNAERILLTTLTPGSANNAINVIRARNKIPNGVKVNHYLTDTDAWFIKTNCPIGMTYQERRADKFAMDNDFDTENGKYKATARYAVGCSDERGIFGSPGA
ncbi:hypothetical protein LCGC14_0711630 [marine sediment metagenome]|uniref:Uncharacterized protein n=1 Tax=marine sediment metagenome TaxID=412755 RepID=A0A0F9TMG3_9ZZZZ